MGSASIYFNDPAMNVGAPVSARLRVKSIAACSVFSTVSSWYVFGCDQPIALPTFDGVVHSRGGCMDVPHTVLGGISPSCPHSS